MTYTYVIMEVSQTTYDEVRNELEAASYEHAINDIDGELDMHGIVLAVVEEKLKWLAG